MMTTAPRPMTPSSEPAWHLSRVEAAIDRHAIELHYDSAGETSDQTARQVVVRVEPAPEYITDIAPELTRVTVETPYGRAAAYIGEIDGEVRQLDIPDGPGSPTTDEARVEVRRILHRLGPLGVGRLTSLEATIRRRLRRRP